MWPKLPGSLLVLSIVGSWRRWHPAAKTQFGTLAKISETIMTMNCLKILQALVRLQESEGYQHCSHMEAHLLNRRAFQGTGWLDSSRKRPKLSRKFHLGPDIKDGTDVVAELHGAAVKGLIAL